MLLWLNDKLVIKAPKFSPKSGSSIAPRSKDEGSSDRKESTDSVVNKNEGIEGFWFKDALKISILSEEGCTSKPNWL